MKDPTDILIEILETTNNPVYQQGSMSEDAEYPETLITFWNNTTPEHSHYDNEAYGTEWNYAVNVYSTDQVKLYETVEDIRKKLKSEGWICGERGHDIPSDMETHTGRGLETTFLNFGGTI